ELAPLPLEHAHRCTLLSGPSPRDRFRRTAPGRRLLSTSARFPSGAFAARFLGKLAEVPPLLVGLTDAARYFLQSCSVMSLTFRSSSRARTFIALISSPSSFSKNWFFGMGHLLGPIIRYLDI